jgi:hypothetical protein
MKSAPDQQTFIAERRIMARKERGELFPFQPFDRFPFAGCLPRLSREASVGQQIKNRETPLTAESSLVFVKTPCIALCSTVKTEGFCPANFMIRRNIDCLCSYIQVRHD